MSLVRVLLDELRDDPAALAELRGLLAAEPTVFSCETLAAEVGCTPRTIRAAIERGELAAVRSGRRWIIAAEAVAAWATPVAESGPRRQRVRRGPAHRPLRDALVRLDEGGAAAP